MQPNSESTAFGKESFILGTGKLAKQANGAVTVTYGGTVVLVTACMSKNIREGQDFFPLTVDYQEKTYAAGRIPGGFFKREGRPSESEILTCRLIDRPIRPLFPAGMLNEVQIVAVVLSSDGENDPDVMAVNAASAALAISDIPFNGPAACCRVGRVKGELILNPTYAQRDAAELDVIVVAGDNGICMLESKAYEVSEEDYLKAVKFGYDALQDMLAFQKKFIQKYGKAKDTDIVCLKTDASLGQKVESLARDRLVKIYSMGTKEEREDNVALLFKEIVEGLAAEGHTPNAVKSALLEVEEALVRTMILEDNVRVDGRGFRDIRPITCEAAVLPRTHGSALFTRGQTQSLAVTTLGTGDDEQMIEALEGEQYKTFMLHYNFPPFSVGETGRMGGAGRREIGHGALAEKALAPVMPTKEQFPYTVRVVSEILESNGSSSMATVCASCLSLMDAGVPIKEPVSGIALGFIKGKGRSIVLTDIAGVEDHFGDMDLKVAGTKNGVTAVQMDLKIDGITLDELTQCLAQAREARMTILGKMTAVLQKPRGAISSYAPRIEKIKINTEKIGAVIGPGGKTIKAIIAATGATIDIDDDGTVLIASNDNAKSQAAIAMIKAITDDVEVGRIYPGKVKRVTNFGAFCEIAPGKEGLVHVSELSNEFVKDVASVVKVGDEFKVKVVAVDEMGRINLSKKRAEEPSKK
ncbi:MAG: polyribonucleotide nucleotidyltransferase [Candidatus Omnitrophica bacterium]|nr:polyribonucleotide nucleotidyltransferase [Candidatus Omnitrophota bacterium]